MSLESRQIFRDLGFTQEWVSAGIVTEGVLKGLEVECGLVAEPNPEHYRWKVMNRFLTSRALSDDDFDRLYPLGKKEANPRLGAAIMGALIKHERCPRPLLEGALASEHAHIVEMARKKLEMEQPPV